MANTRRPNIGEYDMASDSYWNGGTWVSRYAMMNNQFGSSSGLGQANSLAQQAALQNQWGAGAMNPQMYVQQRDVPAPNQPKDPEPDPVLLLLP